MTRTIASLDELVALVRAEDSDSLYIRWSAGPDVDLRQGQSSRDGLTGVALPGLSASPLRVEPWWDRSLRLWLARRLYDYRHLPDLRGPAVRPWVLRGVEVARGPDNEPLVRCERPVAWVTENVLGQAEQLIQEQDSPEWGPMDRR
ncbi:hypothetical protein ALI144C_20555 [Actinosynnema sp. ALI-1.44]|uniref:DUF6098 family protein n=1 Tax=Actinosynnema sp. ALI-1.44 TaxID=1933779 RepID=UPI00097CBC11|nr:DUF6098 family protein [Actinosynnema sp. ALI-1.44]ONI81325.1 hypothetical protein ALI144C_20555 [Actinosynnema sp. ALI-1.44]